ncbi:mannose-6-phosphate isomerase, class I [candidate division KSB1 bacterium]|nr:mannose-6-phosphate isomerase, class I [candidate division KSB1 bacterium]
MHGLIKSYVIPPYFLEGYVQHYDWGGYSFIPALLGISNKNQRPFAELWLGDHPKGTARAILIRPQPFGSSPDESRSKVGLDEVISWYPAGNLGYFVMDKFGPRLPFLLKILDARAMLSIQVHPTKEQAEIGFAAEEAAGVPIDAPQRNYKDKNHKPEAHVALTDFYMLHGFRPLHEIADVIASIPSFKALAPDFNLHIAGLEPYDERREELLRDLYRHLMLLPQAEVDRAIDPLLARIEPLYDNGQLKKISPHYWAVKAARAFRRAGSHRDRGIFSIYLLNLLHLKAGQGTFQAAGVLHAYLEGATVEIMASSDNVLRGGLTNKHVDVEELLKIVDFRCGPVELLSTTKQSEYESVYQTPADDFQLSRIELERGQIFTDDETHGLKLFLIYQGMLKYQRMQMIRGECYFFPAPYSYALEAIEPSILFKASVPAGGLYTNSDESS